MHSLLNIMNVLIAELHFFGHELGDDTLFQDSIDHCYTIAEALGDRQEALHYAQSIDATKGLIRDNIRKVLDQFPDKRRDPEVEGFLNNINSIFGILDIRVREVLARMGHPGKWVTYEIDELTNNFIQVFTAIELNSKGRYHIVYNIASQAAIDYYVDFKITSVDGNTITIPAVFQDVMRDLIANARKYTPPGGSIRAGLHDDGTHLRFVVEDTGRGIPEDQIEAVVQFGERATNVLNKTTMGGGFGLTKAYFVTRQFQGRMWIESEEGVGTKVSIEIPRPGA
ncbi:MAG: ATP-binding protein [Candidatus Neomarinimicrobiota bacterium]|nr:MAG: ATP-binding protein [Candidatus Neomarinimicrobiota bacterium]